MYSQKPLIELLKQGQFPGETGQPKHIETVISNVFLFEKNVYKFYKNDNEFINKNFMNISGKLERFDFTRQDFTWNQTLSPAIYLRLRGVAIANGQIIFPQQDTETEELLIVMNRVNAHDILFEKLMANKVSAEESFLLGQQLAQNLAKVEKPLPKKYNYYDIFGSRVADLRNWIKSVEEYISVDESGLYCDYLEALRNRERKWFEEELSTQVTYGGDIHSHNAVVIGDRLHLMDTYPPKEAWRIEHRLVPLYRVGVDIWALSGKRNLFESFIAGYEAGSGLKIDRRLDAVYVVQAAAIMVSYLYMLQRTDISKREAADKFHQFIRDYFESVQK